MAKNSKQKIVLDYLLTYIDQNKFTSNTKLPSEIFLTKRLSVCRETVRRAIKALEDKGYVFASAAIEMVPQNYVKLTSEVDIKNMTKMIDLMEDNDDIQNVYHNWEQE